MIFSTDLTIDQGADFTYTTCPWTKDGAVVDLTGRTYRFDIFVNDYDVAPQASLTGATDGVAGTVTLYVPRAVTKMLPVGPPLRYTIFVDDLEPVLTVSVTSGGSGYTSVPTVIFTPVSGGQDAAAIAVVTGGVVTAVRVTNPGYDYAVAPTVSFSGGGGAGAAATSTVSSTTTSALLQYGSIFFNTTPASA